MTKPLIVASESGDFFSSHFHHEEQRIEMRSFSNSDTITENVTIPINKNAMIIGPVNFTGNLTIHGNLSIV